MLKPITDEIVNQIVTNINSKDYDNRDAEETKIIIDNTIYAFKVIEDTGWEDDDKYDYRTMIFQLVERDNKWKILNEFDVYFEQCSSRTGSYYTDWYYGYNEITRLKRVEKIIPEQIIPEHTVIEWEKY